MRKRGHALAILLLLISLIAAGQSSASEEPANQDLTACSASESSLCLNQSRFRVELTWKDYQGITGIGHRVTQGSADSGLMWFFSPDNWEVLVKVLDGCQTNNRFWVFAAATTDVEYQLRVTDTQTGAVKIYRNALGNRSPAITDTEAFATCPGSAAPFQTDPFSPSAAPNSGVSEGIEGAALEVAAACVPSDTILCLNQGRFQVEVEWSDFSENSGSARRVAAGSANSGLFYFFASSNWEMLVKVLDGCGLNNRFWVYAAATTNVAYTLKVTDTTTGLSRFYTNPIGVSAAAITDSDAFATCSLDPSLPPDPGTPGMASVPGTDADHDSIRDDVQRYIAIAYAGKPEIVRSLRQKAKAIQDAIVGAASSQSSFENAVKDLRAAECRFAQGNAGAKYDILALDAVVLNTPARFQRYRTYLRHLAGQTFPTRPRAEWGTSCASSAAAGAEALPDAGSLLNSAVLPATGGCSSGTTSVYYGNGIMNSFAEAQDSLLALQNRAVGYIPASALAETSFALAYNPTEGFLGDLWEAAGQNSGTTNSRFFRILYGIEVMPRFFRERLMETERRAAQDAVLDNAVLDNHVAAYRRDIFEGRKVILVAHSQGNFFANAAWISMSNEERQSFGLISVANPAQLTGDSGPEINLVSDKVILFLRGLIGVNISNGYFFSETWGGHNFVASYLDPGSNSERAIMNRWNSLLANLRQPEDQAGDGIITVSLTWGDQPDVDLHAFEPNGFHVYYAQRFGYSGFLDVDDTTGRGPEHYFVKCEDLETGTYRIGVNYYRGSGTETANIQIKAGILARNFRQTLNSAIGSAGDASPRMVGNIVVTGSPATGYNFQIVDSN